MRLFSKLGFSLSEVNVGKYGFERFVLALASGLDQYIGLRLVFSIWSKLTLGYSLCSPHFTLVAT